MLQNKELERNARAYVDEVWEDVVRDIDRLVQVESVEDKEHAQEGAPYGPAPLEAMTRALRIAERLGLEPHNCEGHIGFADLKGKSVAVKNGTAGMDFANSLKDKYGYKVVVFEDSPTMYQDVRMWVKKQPFHLSINMVLSNKSMIISMKLKANFRIT